MADEVGRPTVMTNEVLQKLEYAFMRGMTDRQACLYANIATSTLYNYCNENPDFSERKETLKQNPTSKARLNVTKAIEQGDVSLSLWWLERKARDEFSTKQNIDADIAVKRLEDVL